MFFVRSVFENVWTPCQLAPWGSSLVLVFSKHLSLSRQGYEKLGEVEEEQDTRPCPLQLTVPFCRHCSEAVIEFDAQMFQDDVPQDATETATKVLRVAKTRRYAIHSFGREVEWLEEGSKIVSDKNVHI